MGSVDTLLQAIPPPKSKQALRTSERQKSQLDVAGKAEKDLRIYESDKLHIVILLIKNCALRDDTVGRRAHLFAGASNTS